MTRSRTQTLTFEELNNYLRRAIPMILNEMAQQQNTEEEEHDSSASINVSFAGDAPGITVRSNDLDKSEACLNRLLKKVKVTPTSCEPTEDPYWSG